MRVLDFIFIGPQRTGTTWIYEHLKEHSDICFPKGVKETMFFDRNYGKGIDWYNWHFSECKPGQKRGEVAPTYFNHPDAPARIREQYPDCKLIVSLRDPVERARSLYQHHYQKGRVMGSFSQAIETRPDILTSGYYADHLPRWFKHFEESRILVIATDDIKSSPEKLLDTLCAFIGIKNTFPIKLPKEEKINTAVRPRSSGLAKLGSSIATKLHSLRLHGVVNMAKRVGLKSLFFQKQGEMPGLTEKERSFLEDAYAPHILYVNGRFENIGL